jgi:hypothetical protein
VSVSEGFSTTFLLAQLPEDRTTNFGLYHLRIQGQPGGLRSDFTKWSTDSDATPGSFDRTFRFSWLLHHLVQAQFEWDRHAHPLFLTLQYR